MCSSAEELGINEYVTAYASSSLQPDDLLKGINFASGGAGYDPLTAHLVVQYIFCFLSIYYYKYFYFFITFIPRSNVILCLIKIKS